MREIKSQREVASYNGNVDLKCHFCKIQADIEITFKGGEQIAVCSRHYLPFEVHLFLNEK